MYEQTPEEFGAGHLEMPKCLIGMSLILWKHFSGVDKDKTIICVLQDGRPEALRLQEKAKVIGHKAVVEFGRRPLRAHSLAFEKCWGLKTEI